MRGEHRNNKFPRPHYPCCRVLSVEETFERLQESQQASTDSGTRLAGFGLAVKMSGRGGVILALDDVTGADIEVGVESSSR